MTRVLQTRNIGMRTHYSGHPMAPMEIVYEVEDEPKRPWLTKRRMWMIGSLIVMGFPIWDAIWVFGPWR